MPNLKQVSQGHPTHTAFTMIELVFVIVVLGILAAVAIPKFSATRTDAEISKGRSDIASVRSAIVTERQTRLIKGDRFFIATGSGDKQMDDGGLFGGVLLYPITDSTASGHWTYVSRDANKTTYKFKIGSSDTTFVYNRADGTFDCTTGTYCSTLTD